MNNSVQNLEMAMLKKIAASFERHPAQLNAIMEADAEIISMKGIHPDYLVCKTDGIYEEIRMKLYEDPYLIGWMSVTVTISDLAAVGADPFGLLISLVLPKEFSESWVNKFQQGVNDACNTYKVKVIGGDTNFDSEVSVSTTGIATIQGTKPMLRNKMAEGDLLYSTSRMGIGNAFAYEHFFNSPLEINYQPIARLKESRIVREFASSCIDTSDGLFPALSILAELNNAGIKMQNSLSEFLCPATETMRLLSGLPQWMFLAGPHGEYELLFTIPPGLNNSFLKVCKNENWDPLFLGEIIGEKKLEFISDGIKVSCGVSEIANLYTQAAGDVVKYFEMLSIKNAEWSGLNTTKNAS